ncbi:uncharacterized protein N7506_008208 [Penicillium brevicompactum]|uniref:uncharacterized protein n=1 Tax=Penicillium brevicompactum TaxID=5074 RepID=UPI00254054C1|nr:uncharacterized protein N7506_008208 [Penicillium brevicompactum]KAJ5334425.1 hypothetical protein N7506_008208 [Penicillium brevicompactum]
MKLSTALSVLPFLAGTDALPKAQRPARFDVIVTSEGPIQYRALASSSSFFWLGKGDGFTDSYCPPDIEKTGRCPPGKVTVLKNAHTLDSVLPGQIIYVDSNRAVRATGPNQTEIEEDRTVQNPIKPDDLTDGFKYVPGDRHGTWTFKDHGADGFMACPYQEDIYQVYVNSPDAKPQGHNLDDCVPFTAGAFEYSLPANTTAAAWEY